MRRKSPYTGLRPRTPQERPHQGLLLPEPSRDSKGMAESAGARGGGHSLLPSTTDRETGCGRAGGRPDSKGGTPSASPPPCQSPAPPAHPRPGAQGESRPPLPHPPFSLSCLNRCLVGSEEESNGQSQGRPQTAWPHTHGATSPSPAQSPLQPGPRGPTKLPSRPVHRETGPKATARPARGALL